MTVRFNKFWQMCIEHDIKPSFFYSDKSSPFFICQSSLYEMRHNRPVDLRVIDKICSYFKCQPCDIMEFVDD